MFLCCMIDYDLLSPDLNRDLSRKEGLRGQPKLGVDSNSQILVSAVNCCQLPPFTRRFRLGFALLLGGYRINHHRVGVFKLILA